MTQRHPRVCADCAGSLHQWRIVFVAPRPAFRRRNRPSSKVVCVLCYAHYDANGKARHELNELAAMGVPVLGVDIVTEEVSNDTEE